MEAMAVGQEADRRPPVLGENFAITLDATSRSYDLGGLGLGGLAALATNPSLEGDLFVSIRASVACFVAFSNATGGTIDGTATTAAGGTLAAGATTPWEIAANEELRVRISRLRHRYIYLRAGGAGIARIAVSSPAGR